MKVKKKILIPLILLMIAAIAAMGIYAKRQLDREVPLSAGMSVYAQRPNNFVVRNGEVHYLRPNLATVLLVGTDGQEEEPDLPEDIVPFYNQIQADFLFVIVIDDDAREYSAIQINRDTMMDVPWLDVLGNYGGTNYEQIALSHNSGSGGIDSLSNTSSAVSSLLFSLPLDYAFSYSMTGIGALNDIVGGVTVTVEEDLTPADPTLIKGKTIKLNGKQAESFLRARMVLADDTNIARMKRHRQYIDGYIVSAREKINSESDFVMKAIEKLSDYMVTELDARQLASLVTKLDSYEFKGIVTAKGELVLGEHYEFYADEDDLWSIVLKACCID